LIFDLLDVVYVASRTLDTRWQLFKFTFTTSPYVPSTFYLKSATTNAYASALVFGNEKTKLFIGGILRQYTDGMPFMSLTCLNRETGSLYWNYGISAKTVDGYAFNLNKLSYISSTSDYIFGCGDNNFNDMILIRVLVNGFDGPKPDDVKIL
jgi:hypothetical protein